MHRYRAFGLEIVSEIVCPELRGGEGSPDIVVAVGPVLEPDVEAGTEATPGRLVFFVPRVARFSVVDGNAITVEPVADADAASIRLHLLGTAIGALLHQRCVLPLHGAALRSPDGYVLITGESGAGKSSLAAALVRQGWPAGSDDVSAVSVIDDTPMLMPGYPEAKVWPDVLAMTGDNPDRYERVHPEEEKRRVPIVEFCAEPAPVVGVVILTVGELGHATAQRVSGGTEMTVLKHHTYRPGLSVPLGAHRAHFATIARLAATVPMWHVERPTTGCEPDALAQFVVDTMAK